MKLTLEDIQAAKTHRNGWSRKTLAGWGVPWPPPKGWRDALIAGTPIVTARRLPPAAESKLLWKLRHEQARDEDWREPGLYQFICAHCKTRQTQELAAVKAYRAMAACRGCNRSIRL